MRKNIFTVLALTGAISVTGCANGSSVATETAISTTAPTTFTETVAESTAESTEKLDAKMRKKWVRDINNTLSPKLAAVPGVSEKLSDEDRNERISSLVADIEKGILDNTQILFRIRELISDIGIGYIFMNVPQELYDNANMEMIPIAGCWLAEGFYINACSNATPELLGTKLVSVNGVPFEEIIKKYDSIYANETENGLKAAFYNDNFYGLRMMDLNYLGITEEGQKKVPVVVEDSTSAQLEVILDTYDVADDAAAEKYMNQMVEWSESLDKRYPDALYDENDMAPFIYDIHPDKNMVYLQYNECYDSTCGDDFSEYPCFADFFDSMMSDIEKQGDIDMMIVDITTNEGGYEKLWNDAMEKYKSELQDMHFKFLVGKFTSGAVDCVDTTLDMFKNVTIYGEETNRAIHNYTYARPFELSELGIVFWAPTAEDNIRALDKKYSDLSKGIIPDVAVVQTYDDFIHGIDTVYEMAAND